MAIPDGSMHPSQSIADRINAIRHRLDTPVHIAFLVIFRIAFGLLIALDMFWYFRHGFIATYYIEPTFTFTYFGFSWVQPLPGSGMYLVFALVGLSGLLMAAGWHYRLASLIFVAGFSYLFLIDQTLYLNHNYMIILIGLIMTAMPAHRAFSVDAWRGRVAVCATAPSWCLWWLRAQIGLVYFYGGVAKINPDWLRGEPLRMWLAGRRDMAVIGPWLDTEFTVYFFSYGGLFFDLLIAPLLLFRRTRIPSLIACVFFHLTNAMVFDIGIFPWLMLATTFLFFPPDTIARWLPAIRSAAPQPSTRPLVFAALTVMAAIQIIAPLRHWWYPGDVAWTEEGHRFSWRMKLRSKHGTLNYRVVDPASGRTVKVPPERFLTSYQTSRMATRPDMILQAAHWLARQGAVEINQPPQVFADAFCSLNGRAPQRLIDPTVDLAAQPRNLGTSPWILPFNRTPIRTPSSRREVPIITPGRAAFAAIPDTPAVRSAVMQRLVQQQIDYLNALNQRMHDEFGVIADGFYTLDGNTIYTLQLKPEWEGRAIQLTSDDPVQLARYFTITPHRSLRQQNEIAHYHHLAREKQQVARRLELLAGLAPPESMHGLETE
jgi:hypothetical protein